MELTPSDCPSNGVSGLIACRHDRTVPHRPTALVAEGPDNTTITRHLVPSPKTVRHHVSDVFAKIQAPDRPGAIVLAHRHGLGS